MKSQRSLAASVRAGSPAVVRPYAGRICLKSRPRLGKIRTEILASA
jgi:hypothetical protein